MSQRIKPNDLCLVIGAPPEAQENIGAQVIAREKYTCSCGAEGWMVTDFSRPPVASAMGPFVFYMSDGPIGMHASHLMPLRGDAPDEEEPRAASEEDKRVYTDLTKSYYRSKEKV